MTGSSPGSAWSTVTENPASAATAIPRRSGARSSVLVALSAAFALAMTDVTAVQIRAGQVIDTRAMLLVAHTLAGADWTTSVLRLVSPATVALATALLSVLAWARAGARAAAAAAVTVAGTAVAAIVLKALLHRPMLLDDTSNSLPSGHVAAVAGLVAALALAASKRVRPLVILVGVGAIALTGLATMALQWHRPSDVLASALLAIGVAATTRSAIAIFGAPTPQSGGRRRTPSTGGMHRSNCPDPG